MIPYPEIPPYFFKVGTIEFRWYGLMYALSFVIGYLLIKYLVTHSRRFKGLKFQQNDIVDLVFIVLVGVIIGGRLGYVLFYNFNHYIQNPLAIVALWEGGMSFHGGLIGVVIAGLYFCRKRGIHPYDLGDLLVLVVPIGLGLGRIGNFINGELYGRLTTVPWCMQFPSAIGCRHPSQLYELFLEGIILFIALWLIKDKKYPHGTLFWLFLLYYGTVRFIIEYFREPDAQIGFIFSIFTAGQLLSLPLIFAGAIGLYVVNRTSK